MPLAEDYSELYWTNVRDFCLGTSMLVTTKGNHCFKYRYKYLILCVNGYELKHYGAVASSRNGVGICVARRDQRSFPAGRDKAFGRIGGSFAGFFADRVYLSVLIGGPLVAKSQELLFFFGYGRCCCCRQAVPCLSRGKEQDENYERAAGPNSSETSRAELPACAELLVGKRRRSGQPDVHLSGV